VRPQTPEGGGCSCQRAEGFPGSLALPGRGNPLGWALPGTASWITKRLEANSLPPSQPGWWPLRLPDESVSPLSSGTAAILFL